MLSSRVAGNAALSSHHHEININGLKMIPWAGSQGYAPVYFHLLKEDIIRWEVGEEGGSGMRAKYSGSAASFCLRVNRLFLNISTC